MIDKKKAAVNFFDELTSPGYGLDGRFFSVMGRRLAGMADIQPGHRILDVAAGRGALLFPAAQKAGSKGEVIGIDLADSMVRETSAEIAARGITNARIMKMDAENLEFPGLFFDRVLCGFALFFFPNLAGTLAEFRRVLKHSGRLVVSTFAAGGYPWIWYEDLLEKHGISTRDRDLEDFITDSLDEPDHLKMVLDQAGFSNVEVVEVDHIDAYTDAASWWDQVLSSPDGRLLRGLDEDRVERFKSDAFQHIEKSANAKGLRAVYKALIAFGERVHDGSG